MTTATASQTYLRPKDFSISLLDYQIIERLAARIKPVCRKPRNGKDSELWYCFVEELWNTALTVPVTVIQARDLILFKTITTYHRPVTVDDEKMFMPSAAEVLSQIPSEFLSKVAAYEICLRKATDRIVVISDRDRSAQKAGWFLAEVKLYAKK